MSTGGKLVGLIDLIYEAALDNDLWPAVAMKIADAVGAAQVAMPSFDWRANIFTTVAPRFDPEFLAAYGQHWAFQEPVVPRAMHWPPGKIYALDDLLPREEFASTPVFNEWWQPAGCGLAAMGANLASEHMFTSLICIFNAPGKDAFNSEQVRLFQAALPHISRAVRINRKMRSLELQNLAAAERFETMPQAAMLADAWARVVIANAAAKSMLDARDGIFLRDGRLCVNGSPDALQSLVASCARSPPGKGGVGGELKVPRLLPRAPLRVSVTPLRSRGRLQSYPWAAVGNPVALIMVSDRDLDRRRREMNLRHRFGLTTAEATFAAEILKGDGRKAAARRCRITDETAKSHLASIFEKTGAHRQAELVRLLLDVSGPQDVES
jgi:DNA-binding CsgD family transcriptional regulator